MQPEFTPVVLPDDADAAVDFLVADEWPFHGSPRLNREQAAELSLGGHDVAAFWVRVDGVPVGLIRAFDLDDIPTGSPLLDIRLAAPFRGRGIGVLAVRWLTDHLFTRHPLLVRIEATTRHDNTAMKTVLTRCGYRLEGHLVEAWVNDDGTRADSLIYGLLRREWASAD